MFSSVKADMRRNNSFIRDVFDEGADIDVAKLVVEQAVMRVATPENIAGWYRDSGYYL
jgi:hypothetical protein